MKQLARLRRLRGFSQRALAKESGVSPATIYELENDRREPNPSTLRKLASALEVEVAELIEEPEAPKGTTPPSQLTLNGVLEEERRRVEREELAATLPGWIRAAVEDEGFVQRFEKAKRSAESASRLVAEELSEADRGSERVRELKKQNAPPGELQSARRDLRQAKARFSAAMFLDADLLRGKDVSDLRAVDYVAEIAATQRELLAGGFFEEVDYPQAGEAG